MNFIINYIITKKLIILNIFLIKHYNYKNRLFYKIKYIIYI